MLVVTDLNGNSEPIVDQFGLAINAKVNEEYTLSCTIFNTDNNAHCYRMIKDEAIIECENERYVIKQTQETPYEKRITALHEFFETSGDYVEDVLLDASYSINYALQHAFSSTTDWSFVVEDNFTEAYLKDFGNDNLVSLLNKIIDHFGCEYSFSSTNKVVRIKKRLGIETDYQVRYKHNLVSINRQINSSDVKTAVKVYYNQDEYGEYLNNVVYYSPNRNNYSRIKWDKPLYLDEVRTETEALSRAASHLKDVPTVSVATEFSILQDMGYNGEIALGNSFYLLDERMNFEDLTRIVEIERYPLDESKSPRVVVSNKRRSIINNSVSQKQQYDSLDKQVVKKKRLYNGVTISEEFGVKVTAENGIETYLNATEGIYITNHGRKVYYVDTDGNVTQDGRLKITENGIVMLESYMDEYGGRLIINDNDGNLNVRLGSEESGTQGFQGGILQLYSNNGEKKLIDLSTVGSTGQIQTYYADGSISCSLWAGNLALHKGGEDYPSTFITPTEGRINNETIATQDWVSSFVTNALANYTPLSSE